MASVAVRCGGGGVACCGGVGGSGRNLRAPSNRNATLTMTMFGGGRKERVAPISMSMSMSPTATANVSRADRLQKRRERRRQEEAVPHENVIDEWMRDSVVEIVKNLREAPLLVKVYSDGATRLRTEETAPEDWLSTKTEWEKGTAPKPEGVIFVGQLREEHRPELEPEEESETSTDFEGASGYTPTRAWGVVVQGRGENYGPACYLLKTSRVGAGPGTSSGSGLCCTHFCLVKVKSFRETAESQFKNCWLLNGK